MGAVKRLKKRSGELEADSFRPIFFDLRRRRDFEAVERLLDDSRVRVVDNFEGQLEELFLVRNSRLRFNKGGRERAVRDFFGGFEGDGLAVYGKWVYYKWARILVHLLRDRDFWELFTSRNRDLITEEEQERLRSFRVGVAGMSVGNSVALALALEGFGSLRLADFDTLSLSNLNRIRARVMDLGVNKAVVSARQIYELNPYSSLEVFERGVNRDNLGAFVEGLDLVVDEVDDLEVKIGLREEAKRRGIPVLMATDNGDGMILDVERYDLEPERDIFHGRVWVDVDRLGELGADERMGLIGSVVGEELVAPRMRDSFSRVGKDLYTWPQLGGAALLCGSVVVYVVKRLVLGGEMKSGKYDVNFDRIL